MFSLYNESIYHSLCIKRGAIMKKLFLLLAIFSLFTMSAFAVSLDELRNSPERYKLVQANSLGEEYIDINSISVTRYNPPYYTINATTYIVAYDKTVIMQLNNIFFYNYNQSVNSLVKKFITPEEVTARIKKDTGIKSQIKGAAVFNYDGSIQETYHQYNLSNSMYIPLKADAIFLPSYISALYSFYKSYNMYFNPPSKDQLF